MSPSVRNFRQLSVVTVAMLCLGGSAALAATPQSAIEGVIDNALREEIEQAIGETKTPPQNALDARRRARDAATDVIELLRSEGYYAGAADPDVLPGEPPRAVVRIAPGTRFHLSGATVQWVGGAPDAASAAAATGALHIPAGAPGRAADVLAAEGRVVAALQKQGYADAETRPREVVVDYAQDSVTPTYRIAPGERVRLGAIVVKSKGRSRVRWLRSLAPWKPGDLYDPVKVAKLEQRLVDTGVYNSATVALAPKDEETAGRRPVIVTLVDRPPHTIEAGATYSTSQGSAVDPIGQGLGADSNLQGSGADARFILYNRLGVADTLTTTLHLYDIQQKLAVEEVLPDWRRPDQILRVGGAIARDLTPAYDDQGVGVRLEVERHFTKTTFVTVGAAAEYVSTLDKSAVNADGQPLGKAITIFVPSLLGAVALDRSNSVLDPTRGWRVEARAEPTLVTGDRNLAFVKLQTQVSGYLPFGPDARTVLAGRLKLGEIAGGSIPDVPVDRRFYAGGGGSVRGYGYQQVGPRLSNNTPEGGTSLAEASVEVRQKLTRQLGVVAFADVGAVGVGPAPGFNHPGVGVGLGLRYDLGFGPFRLDVATPLTTQKGDSRIQVYISIGQSF
ncbi:MAG: BamA/TamA family outer membrane protein [Caulobacteraceae bacterium]